MKKILLIEDRHKRQQEFLNKFQIDLEEYQDILENVTGSRYEEFYKKFKDKEVIDDYSVVITHKSSFNGDNQEVLYNIIEYCKEKKIPLVLFSGGISANYYDKTDELEIIELNSKKFYSENLKLFLEEFKKSNRVEVLMLSYGDNWQLNILLNTIEKINLFIEKNEKNEDILYDEFVNETSFNLLENLPINYYNPIIEDGWVYLEEIRKTALSIELYIKKSITYAK